MIQVSQKSDLILIILPFLSYSLITFDDLRDNHKSKTDRKYHEFEQNTLLQSVFLSNWDPHVLEFSPELEAAVTELESQVTECVPLFTANQDPIGDLQILLGDLQSSLAECLRNRSVEM